MSDSHENIFSRLIQDGGDIPSLRSRWWSRILMMKSSEQAPGCADGENIAFVHVTDGAPQDMKDARENGFESREDYARARGEEFHKALKLLNISPRAGTRVELHRSGTTSHMAKLAAQLQTVFMDLKPEVYPHPYYEGGHPDHDSAAWAVAAACERLTGRQAPPVLSK